MCKVNKNDHNLNFFLQGIQHIRSADFEYEEANEAFSRVNGGDFLLPSVIFRAYINICAWHINDDYLNLLASYKSDPVALHMMALYYDDINSTSESVFFNEKSIELMMFPANLLLKARTYGFHDRKNLMISIERLVKNKRFEFTQNYKGPYISAIQLYKEVILKSYMTSVNWEWVEERLGPVQKKQSLSEITDQIHLD